MAVQLGPERGEDDMGHRVGIAVDAKLAEQHRDVLMPRLIGARRVARLGLARLAGIEQIAVALEQIEQRVEQRQQPLERRRTRSERRRAPRSWSWIARSSSSSSASARPERSPKRWKTVPLATPAWRATSSIVTFSTPRAANSSRAAASTRSRLRTASARSGRSPAMGRGLATAETST